MCLERLNEKEIVDLQTIRMPAKISYILKNAMAELGKASKPFFEQKRVIVDKYRENGKIPPEHVKSLLQELKVLHDEEIEMPMEKLDISIEHLPDLSILQIDFIELFFNIKG